MHKQLIEQWVESMLKGILSPPLAIEPESAYEHFLVNCAMRLKKAFTLYQQDRKYLADFLIALRNYLLSFQTKISAPSIEFSEAYERYGIWFDPDAGVIKADCQFPAYINPSFAQAAFLAADHASYHGNKKQYNLQTDPMIFRITGFTQFKSLAQKLAIYGAINTQEGYTTLISLPTGGGKSLITQAVSYQREGLSVIIVPTVSLAIDQVRVARNTIKIGSPEEEVFYYCSGIDPEPILSAIRKRKARMLFISPEALILNNRFASVIEEANNSRFLKNIIIDEAHIVVDWGADFRIDYQCLESWRRKLMLHNPQICTILLSATFERRCRDILKDFFSENEKWIEIRCDALRHEPRYIFVKCRSNHEKNKRIVELVRKCPHPIVVYVARPDDAEHIKTLLQNNGINNVNTFTGLTANSKRQDLINSWVANEFDVMVATSAFGVGVDKGDIRTVLHAYVPQNPNQYYQELGRAGRDQLPCLSIMCMIEYDLDVSFQRISKKVLTPEKIIGRWDSMYNSPLSQRIDQFVMIDTTIKPKYAVDDLFDDSPASEADIRWNVYVLLLLRRYKKMRIMEVIAKPIGYTFVIEVLDGALRNNDTILMEKIEAVRSQEWDYYLLSFALMKKAIQRYEKECWSEMFYETYDKVFEYCAGCAGHIQPNIGDAAKFDLKCPVSNPLRSLSADQLAIFGDSYNLIVQTRAGELTDALEKLSKYRLSCLIVPDAWDHSDFVENAKEDISILILDHRELGELVKQKSWFFISGLVAIVYQGTDRDIYEQLITINSKLEQYRTIRAIHIINGNTYFDWIEKSFSDLLDGRTVQAELLNSL